jgi:hypothetical protein
MRWGEEFNVLAAEHSISTFADSTNNGLPKHRAPGDLLSELFLRRLR